MIGHPQGASGAAGIVTAALAIDRGFLPPTINLRDPDPACDLDFIPNQGRAGRDRRRALQLSRVRIQEQRRRDRSRPMNLVIGKSGNWVIGIAALAVQFLNPLTRLPDYPVDPMLDVLIVGAGPAGAVAATVLARDGARVRIVDRARFPRDKLCGDTVNPGTLALLGRLGLADRLETRGLPIAGMIVTGADGVAVEAPYPDGSAGSGAGPARAGLVAPAAGDRGRRRIRAADDGPARGHRFEAATASS